VNCLLAFFLFSEIKSPPFLNVELHNCIIQIIEGSLASKFRNMCEYALFIAMVANIGSTRKNLLQVSCISLKGIRS
jgi:hypothetical protein